MDNTVGSLTQFQKSVISGCLLGDGYLRIMPGRKNAFLEINHSFGAREYVEWKFQELKSICKSEPVKRKGNGKRIAYRFFTRQHPELTKLYGKFYQGKRKIIPDDLKIDSVILSVWFMDDGSKCGSSNFYLNTQQFSFEDQKKLLERLEILKLRATLNKDKKYYRIRFLSTSIVHLKELMRPHIIPSMQYKLGYNPVETQFIKRNELEFSFVKRANTPTPVLFIKELDEDIVRSSP